MPVAHCRLENRQAIINIGIRPLYCSASESCNSENSLPIVAYRALIDTGAQRTCLTYKTIAAEGLKRHGHKLIRNVHGEETHSLYLAVIGVFCTNENEAEVPNSPQTFFGIDPAIEVINIADNRNFDAILGMDVLQEFNFSFSNDRTFSLVLP